MPETKKDGDSKVKGVLEADKEVGGEVKRRWGWKEMMWHNAPMGPHAVLPQNISQLRYPSLLNICR